MVRSPHTPSSHRPLHPPYAPSPPHPPPTLSSHPAPRPPAPPRGFAAHGVRRGFAARGARRGLSRSSPRPRGHPRSSPCCAWEVCAKGAGLASAAPHAGGGQTTAPPRGTPSASASWPGAQFPAPLMGEPHPPRWGDPRHGRTAQPPRRARLNGCPTPWTPSASASWPGAQFPAPLMGEPHPPRWGGPRHGRRAQPPRRGRPNGCPSTWYAGRGSVGGWGRRPGGPARGAGGARGGPLR